MKIIDKATRGTVWEGKILTGPVKIGVHDKVGKKGDFYTDGKGFGPLVIPAARLAAEWEVVEK